MKTIAKHWWPTIALMAVIMVASSDLGSDKRTSRFIDPMVRQMFGPMSPARLAAINGVVRKTAHVVEYALLAYLVAQAAARSRLKIPVLRTPWRAGVACLLVATAFAASDEFHQKFVPSRNASVRDVMLDVGGAGLGLSVALGAGYLLARQRREIECRVGAA